ncbi:MAG: DUF4442 domain-containing protein [Pseudomonadota bacterium]
MNKLIGLLPQSLQAKAMFHLAVRRVPMMRYVQPRLEELSAQKVVVSVPLSRRTRNLHDSMFIGAFSIAADLVAGVFPIRYMFATGHVVPPIVKTSSAQFYKRVGGRAHFTCIQGEELSRVCEEAARTRQRIETPIEVLVTAPEEFGDQPVARIEMLLSIKRLN